MQCEWCHRVSAVSYCQLFLLKKVDQRGEIKCIFGCPQNYDRPIVDTSQQETGESRWSPAALERQMAAELARLESLEDSIRQLSSAERTRAVALAQQETVSVAQVLKVRPI